MFECNRTAIVPADYLLHALVSAQEYLAHAKGRAGNEFPHMPKEPLHNAGWSLGATK